MEDKGIMQEQRAGKYEEKVVTKKQNTSHQHFMGNREVSYLEMNGERGIRWHTPLLENTFLPKQECQCRGTYHHSHLGLG